MRLLKLYKTIYFLGIVLIFIGGYRLFKNLDWGELMFAAGILMYSGIQIFLLFFKSIADWRVFEFLKLSVNLLFLLSIVLLLIFEVKMWYYSFTLGLLIDFFCQYFKTNPSINW